MVVAYQFPPYGGSGVQRTLKFVKFLPQFDWQPVVVTRDTGKMLVRDESLVKEIPAETEIIRTPAHDMTVWPGPLAKIGKGIAWKLMTPDAEAWWMKGAIKAAEKRIEKGDISVVYTTSYPYSDHLVGLALKRKFPQLYWVVDFRDEWMYNPYLLDHPHMAWRMKREAALEKAVLAESDRLITNSPGMKANFVKNHAELPLVSKMAVIPNGFDKDDFTDLPSAVSRNSRFQLVYTGALYGRRKPDLLLEAIGILVADGQVSAADIELVFIGSYKADHLMELAKKNGLGNSVTLKGYMDHGACLTEMMHADALLLLEGGGPGAEAFFTGKVFEYIHTGKPILAVVPGKGAAAGVVQDTATGVVSDCQNREEIQRGFKQLYQDWKTGSSQLKPNLAVISAYERRNLTKALSFILNKTDQMEGTT